MKNQIFGLGSSGALLMLPLTPRICALCYDGDVYSVENAAGWSTVKKPTDVLSINEHQYLKCGSNLYFSNWDELARVANEFNDVVGQRLEQPWEVIIADLVDSSEEWERYKVVPRTSVTGARRSFLNLRAIYPIPRRWPSLLRYRSNPSILSNGSATGFVRRSVAEAQAGIGLPYRKAQLRQ
jgi:hypothetical protein